MPSKFRKCYVFTVEGINKNGRPTIAFERAVDSFLELFPELFQSLVNSDEKIKVFYGSADCQDIEEFSEYVKLVKLDKFI